MALVSTLKIGDLYEDMQTLIFQLIQNEEPELFSWILNKENSPLAQKIPLFPVDIYVDEAYNFVSQWDECDCRGRPHIENIKKLILDKITLQPAIHYLDNNHIIPLDGRHRVTACKEMGIDTISSINLFDVIAEIKKMKSVSAL